MFRSAQATGGAGDFACDAQSSPCLQAFGGFRGSPLRLGTERAHTRGVKNCRSLFATVLLLTSASSPLWSAGDADDPILGAWKLNVTKSKYVPGPAPQSETRTYRLTDAGIVCTIDRVDSKGVHQKPIQFAEKYDGKTYPITGSAVGDALELKRINNYLAEATMKHAGMVVAITRRIITDNGKTLMLIYKETDPEHPVDNVIVYDHVQ